MKAKEYLTATNIVAALILLVAVLRLIYGDGGNDRFGETTLLYFFGAAAVFLLARAKTFKFGDLELELQQLKSEVASARLEAGIAEDAAKLAGPPPAAAVLPPDMEPRPGNAEDDPWKGVFGGNSVDRARGRALTARVDELVDQPGWYAVVLTVARTGEDKPPLQGPVQFFLHDTFHNDRPVIDAVRNQATLRLRAWGAFTVGVLADNGQCRLELDLAQLDSAPLEFRLR